MKLLYVRPTIFVCLATLVQLAFANVSFVVDNDDGAPAYVDVGSWLTSSYSGYDDGTYRSVNYSDPVSTATWTFSIPDAGVYEISSIYRSGSNRSPVARYSIMHDDGSSVVEIDQTGDSSIDEKSLGFFPFSVGESVNVHLTNMGATAYVIADAIRFRNVSVLIDGLIASPHFPNEADKVVVSARVSRLDVITSAVVTYSTSFGGGPMFVTANNDGIFPDITANDEIFSAAIPPQPVGTQIDWSIEFADADSNTTQSETQSYVVNDSSITSSLVFLIAGQSNASGRGELDENNEQPDPNVWMFGNDYIWKEALEPVDDGIDQVDEVSYDYRISSTLGHSFMLRAGKDCLRTSGTVSLIPCPLGGTNLTQWERSADPFDRNTLFGSMNFRRFIAAPNGLTALWWYQGESDSGTAAAPLYIGRHTEFISNVREEWRNNLPVIYVQLGGNTNESGAINYHAIAEKQRLMETGSGSPYEILLHNMVVGFDLPLGEGVHLDRSGYIELGRRVALATREHILGEKVDGTGPRLDLSTPIEFMESDKQKILIRFDKPVNTAINNYDNQFRVYDNDVEVNIASVIRDPSDVHNVLIELSVATAGIATVSYGEHRATGLHITLDNVVKGETGLPAPRFGPLPVPPPSGLSSWYCH